MMKKVIVLAVLFSNLLFSHLAVANEQTENPDAEFVRDTYEYCKNVQDQEAIDKNVLLECVNSEMDYYQYTRFTSLEKVLEFIASVIDDLDR